jgi:DNA mismatch repair protein MutL
VTLLALARPDVGVSLTSGGRRTIDAPGVDGLAARLYQLLGTRSLEDLVPVDGEEGWARVRGLVSRPERASASRGVLRLFVNRRPVRDRALSKAVTEAYRAAGARDPRPEAFLFLEAPPSLVDVNVHPAKTEVRFADGRVVWNAVERSVRDALSAGSRVPPRAPTPRVEEAVERYVASRSPAEMPAEPRPLPRPMGSGAVAPPTPLLTPAAPTVLGQHRNTYIVASDGDDILLVDQHTAQERVLFERIRERRAKQGIESQLLLSALTVDLSPDVAALLEEHAVLINALGFDAEPFGGGSVRLRAVPALLGSRDPGVTLQGILRDLLERDAAEWAVAGAEDRLAATLACHASVRGGEPLRQEVMTVIVRDLFAATHPGLCPHGRPTSMRIPREDVARWFGRAGWRRQ